MSLLVPKCQFFWCVNSLIRFQAAAGISRIMVLIAIRPFQNINRFLVAKCALRNSLHLSSRESKWVSRKNQVHS